MTRVLHVITGLGRGGAQTMLREVVARGASFGLEAEVVSLTHGGVVAEEIRQTGVTVHSLGMGYGLSGVLGWAHLAAWIRRRPPDVIQSWLYHADLAVASAVRLPGMRRVPVIWGLHVAGPTAPGVRPATRWVARACAALSGWFPEVVVACAPSVAEAHTRAGYAPSAMEVISNGVDPERYSPVPEERKSVRHRLGIASGQTLIVCLARDHPVKDLGTLLRVFGPIARQRSGVRLALVGAGLDPGNLRLREATTSLGISDRVLLCGETAEASGILNAADLVVLTSVSEAQPMVLLEAMSCGVPVCATDVGDCAESLGEPGLIAPPKQEQAISATWERVLDMSRTERKALGERLRKRVVEHYSIGGRVQQYAELYRRVAEGHTSLGES